VNFVPERFEVSCHSHKTERSCSTLRCQQSYTAAQSGIPCSVMQQRVLSQPMSWSCRSMCVAFLFAWMSLLAPGPCWHVCEKIDECVASYAVVAFCKWSPTTLKHWPQTVVCANGNNSTLAPLTIDMWDVWRLKLLTLTGVWCCPRWAWHSCSAWCRRHGDDGSSRQVVHHYLRCAVLQLLPRQTKRHESFHCKFCHFAVMWWQNE